MSTLEATSVHLSSAMRSIIPLHDDTVIDFYKELSTALKPHGMKMLQQIYHPGSARAPGKGTTQISASPIPNPIAGGIPIEMTPSMIEEMVQAFADAARRCRDGGLDGVDIHASSGSSLNNSYRQQTIYAPTNTGVARKPYAIPHGNNSRHTPRGRQRYLRRHTTTQ